MGPGRWGQTRTGQDRSDRMRTGRVRSTQVKSNQGSRCNGMRVAAKKQMRMFGAQFRTDYPGNLPRSYRAFSPERHFHAPSKSCHKPTMKHWETECNRRATQANESPVVLPAFSPPHSTAQTDQVSSPLQNKWQSPSKVQPALSPE